MFNIADRGDHVVLRHVVRPREREGALRVVGGPAVDVVLLGLGDRHARLREQPGRVEVLEHGDLDRGRQDGQRVVGRGPVRCQDPVDGHVGRCLAGVDARGAAVGRAGLVQREGHDDLVVAGCGVLVVIDIIIETI